MDNDKVDGFLRKMAGHSEVNVQPDASVGPGANGEFGAIEAHDEGFEDEVLFLESVVMRDTSNVD